MGQCWGSASPSLTRAEELWDQIPNPFPAHRSSSSPSDSSNTNLSSSHRAYLTPYLTSNESGLLTALGSGR